MLGASAIWESDLCLDCLVDQMWARHYRSLVRFLPFFVCRQSVLRRQPKRKVPKEPSSYSCWRKRREVVTEKGERRKAVQFTNTCTELPAADLC